MKKKKLIQNKRMNSLRRQIWQTVPSHVCPTSNPEMTGSKAEFILPSTIQPPFIFNLFSDSIVNASSFVQLPIINIFKSKMHNTQSIIIYFLLILARKYSICSCASWTLWTNCSSCRHNNNLPISITYK